MGYRMGIDVGGTFTDFVYVRDDGTMGVAKSHSTPENQAKGVLAGLQRIAGDEGRTVRQLMAQTDLMIHGTTVTTNTMLEFNGARTGLITTRGFRDDIELRRGYKERIFNPRYPAPVPIALRRHRLTVNERLDREGKVLTPLQESEVVQAVRRLKDAGIESIAVCFLYSFLNPGHERMVQDVIMREYPEAFVSLSHEVLPQIREFERVSTTLVNAYTSPKLRRYLEFLVSELGSLGFGGEFYVMLSGGGIMSSDYAGKNSVYTLLSGPAGGVVACQQLIGEALEEPNLITIDMGGTSFDVSLIKDGKPLIATDCWFSRYRVAVPMLNIHTIGAGGGSIAWVDSGGALQVGPQSAGAVPGPCCYGKGGTEPTVTDANLVLGFLDPEFFLGGEMKLDTAAAERAIEERAAKPLKVDVVKAAHGIFRIVNNNMSNGIRVVSVQRGHDPRDFTLVAFGGNGAIHAGVLAADLGIRKIIVPRIATAFSARGMLSSDIVINRMRTYIARSTTYDLEVINKLIAEMRGETEKKLPDVRASRSGFAGEVQHRYFIDMHYHGELHEITVPLPSRNGSVTVEDVAAAVQGFHDAHEALHTFANPGSPVFFMNLRLTTAVRTLTMPPRRLEKGGEDPSAALRGSRKVFFEALGGFTDTPVYEGSKIACGNVMRGPCIIEEPATTVAVYPGQVCVLTRAENYEIRTQAPS